MGHTYLWTIRHIDMNRFEEILQEINSSPIYLEGGRDLIIFDELINMNIDQISAHEDEFHEIMGALIESFHGNLYFRTKKKAKAREARLLEIASSGRVKLPDEFLYYAQETSFSSDGYFND